MRYDFVNEFKCSNFYERTYISPDVNVIFCVTSQNGHTSERTFAQAKTGLLLFSESE